MHAITPYVVTILYYAITNKNFIIGRFKNLNNCISFNRGLVIIFYSNSYISHSPAKLIIFFKDSSVKALN